MIMKKLLTTCLFALALLISSQGFAQLAPVSNSKTNIKEHVKKTAETLGLNEEQTDAYANAYINMNKALKGDKANLSADARTKMQQKFIASLKGILTEDQITRLKSLSKER